MSGPGNFTCSSLSIGATQVLNSGSSNLLGALGVGGKVSSYNGILTAGGGVPVLYFQNAVTAQAANFNAGSALTIYTPAATGPIRILFWQAVTQAATVSSTMPSLSLSYTDPSGLTRSFQLVPTDSSNVVATAIYQGSYTAYAQAAGAVTITSTGYASSGVTPMQYALTVTVQQL